MEVAQTVCSRHSVVDTEGWFSLAVVGARLLAETVEVEPALVQPMVAARAAVAGAVSELGDGASTGRRPISERRVRGLQRGQLNCAQLHGVITKQNSINAIVSDEMRSNVTSCLESFLLKYLPLMETIKYNLGYHICIL